MPRQANRISDKANWIRATDSSVRVSIRRQVKTKSRMPTYRFLTNEGLRRHFAARGGDQGASASVTTASLP